MLKSLDSNFVLNLIQLMVDRVYEMLAALVILMVMWQLFVVDYSPAIEVLLMLSPFDNHHHWPNDIVDCSESVTYCY